MVRNLHQASKEVGKDCKSNSTCQDANNAPDKSELDHV